MARKRHPKEELEEYLAYVAGVHGLTWELRPEHRFHPIRKWRFDFAWPDVKIAVEYDGIMYGDASHASVANIMRDQEKINEAQRLGWQVYRANARSVADGTFFDLIDSILMEIARVSA